MKRQGEKRRQKAKTRGQMDTETEEEEITRSDAIDMFLNTHCIKNTMQKVTIDDVLRLLEAERLNGDIGYKFMKAYSGQWE